jgi:threonyl-tRNA synthetase
MIHRVILGSVERFIGVLIEHFAGNFPLWISPVQAVVINVTDNQLDYTHDVVRQLRDAGVRVEEDVRNEKLGFKIREAQLQKIPYMLVIGDKEMESRTVTPRYRNGDNLEPMTVDEFSAYVMQECRKYH